MSESETMQDLARLLEAVQAGVAVEPALTARVREQCRAIAASTQEAEDMAFVEAISFWPSDEPEPGR